MRRQFEEHGEIKTFFDLISNRGMVFVTFVSCRFLYRQQVIFNRVSSIFGLLNVQGTISKELRFRVGRFVVSIMPRELLPHNFTQIDVHYSLPRADEQNGRCDRDKNQVRSHSLW